VSKVCLDTNILIFGLQQKGEEAKVKSARKLIDRLDQSDALVCVPSIVLTEFVVGLDTEKKRRQAIKIIHESFYVIDHNAMAALPSARIFQASRSTGVYDELKDDQNVTRRKIMTDVHILGTAVAHDVDRIYSEDTTTLHKLAEGFVDARTMPTGFQQDLGL
jgi:predicted nucleic acid-binding protein